MAHRVAAILLAAGKSRRMGTCKQLLQLDGKPVMVHCLETLFSGGVADVIVVVSTSQEDVARVAGRYPVQVVCNTNPEGDMASSVRTGRDALPSASTGVLIALSDYPLITPETISCTIEAQRQQPDRIIIPSYNGRRGHPSLFPRPLLDELVQTLTLRDLLLNHPDKIQHLEVQDPGILMDMDTPDDFRRIGGVDINNCSDRDGPQLTCRID